MSIRQVSSWMPDWGNYFPERARIERQKSINDRVFYLFALFSVYWLVEAYPGTLLHEMGHAVVGKACNPGPWPEIVVRPFGGGFTTTKLSIEVTHSGSEYLDAGMACACAGMASAVVALASKFFYKEEHEHHAAIDRLLKVAASCLLGCVGCLALFHANSKIVTTRTLTAFGSYLGEQGSDALRYAGGALAGVATATLALASRRLFKEEKYPVTRQLLEIVAIVLTYSEADNCLYALKEGHNNNDFAKFQNITGVHPLTSLFFIVAPLTLHFISKIYDPFPTTFADTYVNRFCYYATHGKDTGAWTRYAIATGTISYKELFLYRIQQLFASVSKHLPFCA